MAINYKKLIDLLNKNLIELKTELYNKKISNSTYIQDYAESINIYLLLLIYELAIKDLRKALLLGYRLGINSDSYKNMLKNKKVPNWTIKQLLILLDEFNLNFSEIKKNIIFILMKNNNYIKIR